ncbi:MAG: response regulator [Mariprofundaceae bacterium]|nr:response regulator [Mariprofundaceae bacterium]
MGTIDESLLPLFQMEAESQCVTLNEGIMALETNAKDQAVLDALMRAAHSLKGAAAVVGLDAGVSLAHAMEDCFTAAMKDNIVCEPQLIDQLLQATDILSSISSLDVAGFAIWQAEQQADALTLAATLHDASEGKISPPSEKTNEKPLEPTAMKTDDAQADDVSEKNIDTEHHQEVMASNKPTQNQMVRVNSQRLDAFMTLAGEVQLASQDSVPIHQNFLDLQKDLAAIRLQLQALRNQSQADVRLKRSLAAIENRFQHYREHFTERVDDLYYLGRKTASISQRLSYEVMDSRMQKFGDAVASLRRLVRDTARTLGKSVALTIQGEDCDIDREVMEQMQAPLQHIIRNAVDHGIETPDQRQLAGKSAEATIHIEAYHHNGGLHIRIKDDGQGIHLTYLRQSIVEKGLSTADMVEKMETKELLDFLLLPHFSMKKELSNISGRGVGLDLVANTIRLLRGSLTIHTEEGKGSAFDISLPLSLSVVRCLLVMIHDELYGIHLTRIAAVEHVDKDDVHYAESRPYIHWRDQQVGLISASQVLGWAQKPMQDVLHVIVFPSHQQHYGLIVDDVVGETPLMEKKLDERLGKVKDISTGAVDSQGSPLFILDVDDVLLSMQTLIESGKFDGLTQEESKSNHTRKTILVVEDSITVREAERRMLENKGYQVRTAVDGMDGWNALRAGSIDLVMSDIDMPRMNGLELLRLIRSDYHVPDIPVMIVSYKDREEDRLAGMQAGANYYLTKSSFHDNTMLQGVYDLIGEAI